MNRFKAAVVAGGALFATPAFAEEPTDPILGGEEASAEVGTEGMGMESTAVDASATAAVPNWPQAAIDRPYVRPKGSIAAYAQFGLASISIPATPVTPAGSITIDALGIGGAYGVTDQITAGAQYAFSLGLGDNDFTAQGPLTLWGGYGITHTSKLSITATADFTIDLCGGRDVMGDCVSAKSINAGLGARYNLAPNMAVFTGAPFGPGPVGQHLSISLESDGPIDFDVPVGFGFQATPQLFAFAQTQLATIHFNPPDMGDSITFIGDSIPLTLGGLFAVNKNIDVHASLFLDLANIGDVWGFALGGNWYQ